MKNFNKLILKLMEINASGSGGVFGTYSPNTYAPEHGAIVPKILGTYSRKGKIKAKKGKKR